MLYSRPMAHHFKFKLAAWVGRFACFRDGKIAYPTEAEARAAAKAPGRYRVSEVTAAGRKDLEPFEVTGPATTTPAPKRFGRNADRPMAGRPH